MNATRIEAVTTSFFGNEAIRLLPEELKKRGAKRALIVTDKFLFESGIVDKVGNMLLEGNVEYATYYLVQPNPTVEVVEDCIHAAQSLQVDWLVAVGGGSAIDTSKAVSIVLANGGNVQDYEGVNKSRVPGIPIIAVNTTAGTGSEVTTFYIVTDAVSHSKMCMVDVNCKVSIAINDTQFMMGMPRSLTASTGMDAMTHAIEAVFSKRANPLTDKDALWAIEKIKRYLPIAVRDGKDVGARDMMAYAEYTAGMAFSNAGLGMVHAMAHALGGMYNLPHGLCNALLLPYVMEFNIKKGRVSRQIQQIAAALELKGLEQMSQQQVERESIRYIKELSAEVGVNQTLKELKVAQKDFEALANLALHDTCMEDNPVMPSREEVMQTYMAAY